MSIPSKTSDSPDTCWSTYNSLIPDLQNEVMKFLLTPPEIKKCLMIGPLEISYPIYLKHRAVLKVLSIELEKQMSGYLECGFIEALEEGDSERSTYYFEALYDNTVARYRRDGLMFELGADWIQDDNY